MNVHLPSIVFNMNVLLASSQPTPNTLIKSITEPNWKSLKLCWSQSRAAASSLHLLQCCTRLVLIWIARRYFEAWFSWMYVFCYIFCMFTTFDNWCYNQILKVTLNGASSLTASSSVVKPKTMSKLWSLTGVNFSFGNLGEYPHIIMLCSVVEYLCRCGSFFPPTKILSPGVPSLASIMPQISQSTKNCSSPTETSHISVHSSSSLMTASSWAVVLWETMVKTRNMMRMRI